MVKVIIAFETKNDDTMSIDLKLNDETGNEIEKAHAQMFMRAICSGSIKAGIDVSEDVE